MDDPQSIGSWIRVKILGCGGFGNVTLWQKKGTEEYVAIKRPRGDEIISAIKDKQLERWCKEVEIMKKLNHLNIVKALPVPDELMSLSRSPMLAMEYCRLGDLRQVLNKSENCCGLMESTIVKILQDVSSGLYYLHSCKVIHRDLKPDNIVLQCRESVVTYKLIDLGYAKELDQNSVCKSFVGTIQYLAPELFLGKFYTSSVDYWSFGVVAHEIITGYRPFLPGYYPSEWMKTVQNKQRNIISVVENLNGDIIFSSTISRINHASRCFVQDIEQWLKLALDWNGNDRGKDIDTNELVLFDELNKILDKTVIKIFSLPTYDILCYEIKPQTEISLLKNWLERDTGIIADEQILLLRNGKCMESTGLVMNYFQEEIIDRDSASVFLYNCDAIKIKSRVVLKPLYVKELLEDPKKVLNYKHLKRSCSDSVFFVQSEYQLYICLIDAIRAKILNIRTKEESVETLFEDTEEEWNQVESYSQFLIFSHKADLENYIQLRKEGELQSTDLIQKWIHKVTDVENKLTELRSSSNKNKLKLAVNEAKEKCKSLEKNEFINSSNPNFLKDLLSECQIIWERIQKIPKENRNTPRSNTEIVKILYKCIEYTTRLLRSPLLDLLFLQLAEAEEHLTKLISPITIWLKSTKIMKEIIENTQKERQADIWNFVLKKKVETNGKSDRKKLNPADTNDRNAPKEIKTVQSGSNADNQNNNLDFFNKPKIEQNCVLSPADNAIKTNFKLMEPVSVMPYRYDMNFSRLSQTDPDIIRSLESESIINTNNYLRYRVQEINQSWHHLLKEINSLNWDDLQKR